MAAPRTQSTHVLPFPLKTEGVVCVPQTKKPVWEDWTAYPMATRAHKGPRWALAKPFPGHQAAAHQAVYECDLKMSEGQQAGLTGKRTNSSALALTAVSPWASYCTSLSLSFLLCQRELAMSVDLLRFLSSLNKARGNCTSTPAQVIIILPSADTFLILGSSELLQARD